jgi:uncharacterized protein YpmB
LAPSIIYLRGADIEQNVSYVPTRNSIIIIIIIIIIIQFSIIYVPCQKLQCQLQKQHSVDTINYITDKQKDNNLKASSGNST